MWYSGFRALSSIGLLGAILFFFVSCAGDGSVELAGTVLTQDSPSLSRVSEESNGQTKAFVEDGMPDGVHAELTVQELESELESEADSRSFLTAENGAFSINFIPEKHPDTDLLITFQSTLFPFQKVLRGVKIVKGRMQSQPVKIYMASTLISGQVLSTTGKSLSNVDVLIWRDTQEDVSRPKFVPYSFQGAALKSEGAKALHGIYTDDLGYFSIPVHFPDAKFEIQIGVLQKNLYGTKGMTLHVKPNVDNEVGEINIVSYKPDEKKGGGGGGGGGGDGSATVSLSKDVLPILKANCDCHATGGAPQGVNLKSAATVMKTVVNAESSLVKGMLRVRPFDSGGSFFYEKMATTPRAGAKMPMQTTPLKSSDLEIIRKWIDEGARNN